MNRKLWKSCIAAAFFGLVLSVVPAIADEFPAKPVKLVIPWGAGGGMDTMARVLEPVVTKCLGQPLSYVYKPGAGSAIGTAEVAKAPADGYTMSLNLYPQQAINVHLGVAAYAVNDLIPVCMIATDPTILSVVKGSKFKTWEELVAAAKEKPNSVIVGTDRVRPMRRPFSCVRPVYPLMLFPLPLVVPNVFRPCWADRLTPCFLLF